MQRENIKYINPTLEAQDKWKARINEVSDKTLFPKIDPSRPSTYMGGSVPGKAFEQTNYAGGIPAYVEEVRDALEGFKGFEVVKN